MPNNDRSTRSSTTERNVKRLGTTTSNGLLAQALLVNSQLDKLVDAIRESPVTSAAVDFEVDRLYVYVNEMKRKVREAI